jgi:hypothetical protein
MSPTTAVLKEARSAVVVSLALAYDDKRQCYKSEQRREETEHDVDAMKLGRCH